MKQIRSIKGTHDILPIDTYKWQLLESIVHDVCARFGYQEIRTPIFEQNNISGPVLQAFEHPRTLFGTVPNNFRTPKALFRTVPSSVLGCSKAFRTGPEVLSYSKIAACEVFEGEEAAFDDSRTVLRTDNDLSAGSTSLRFRAGSWR